MHDLPLVSVIMLVYNQEKFVLDALSSIISQKYENFEIIISDDCSKDKTVDLINEFIVSRNIVCNIIFNINDENLGISKNFEKAFSFCSGDYICLAAGDDISSESRISVSLNKMLENPNLGAVFSNLNVINEAGYTVNVYFESIPIFCRHLSDVKNGKAIWAIGASLFFKRQLLDTFSKYTNKTFQEDGVLAYRALLVGGFDFIPEPLVFYRIHSSNASQNITVDKKVFFKRQEINLLENAIKDTQECNILSYDKNIMISILRRRYIRLKLLNFFLSIKPFAIIVFSLSTLLRKLALRK